MAHLLGWLQLVVRDTGEPYSPSLADRTLPTVIAYPYSDQTYPWPPESRLRLVLTRDYLLFIQQSILAGRSYACELQRRIFVPPGLVAFLCPRTVARSASF